MRHSLRIIQPLSPLCVSIRKLQSIRFAGAVLCAAALICAPYAGRSQTVTTEQPDNYKWLEDISGDRSMAWVKAENERSAKVLEADPRYAGMQADALKVLESPRARFTTPGRMRSTSAAS
jgi:hypothetical protein